MARENGWSEERKKTEWTTGRKFLVSMGLPEVGKLPGDLDFGKSAKKLTTSNKSVGDLISRAHFTVEELAQLKDVFSQRIGGSVDDATKGVTTGELLALVKEDTPYAKPDTSVSDVLSALQSVGVSVHNAEESTFNFDDFLDVSLFKSYLFESIRHAHEPY